jgi:ubiquinone/menaquinone biosynthesis C-methylase UbiE
LAWGLPAPDTAPAVTAKTNPLNNPSGLPIVVSYCEGTRRTDLAREVLLEPLLRWMRFRQVMPQIPAGARLLDVGCGHSATFLRAAADQIESGVGVDFKVKPMRVQNIQTLQLKLAEALPFEAASFDVVTMLAVLEHIEHEKPILQEVHRVLKPGGKLVLTVPSVWAQPVLEFLSYRLKIVDEREIRDHKRYYTRARLEAVLIQDIQFRNFYHRYFQLGMNNFCAVLK